MSNQELNDDECKKNGDKYYNGIKEQIDYSKAMDYYKQAAEKGNREAMLALARMWKLGAGVPIDLHERDYWLKEFDKSVQKTVEDLKKKNDVRSRFELANILYDVRFSDSDKQKAFFIYMELAEQGFPEAMYRVGEYFRLDILKEGKYRYNEAEKWLLEAFKHGVESAAYSLKEIYKRLNDSKKYRFWKYIDDKQNPNGLYFDLAQGFMFGIYGKEKNLELARKFYREYINTSSDNFKGDAYWIWGMNELRCKNYKYVIHLLKEAIYHGCAHANDDLGDALLKIDANKNRFEAICCYERAGEHGIHSVWLKLGKMFYYGEGVERDINKAEEYFSKGLYYFDTKKEADFYLIRIHSEKRLEEKFDFFQGCQTLDQAERNYKKLINIYHPDLPGGNEEYTKEINNQFDQLKKNSNQKGYRR